MNLTSLRILGSGYTEEECSIYGLDRLSRPDEATRYLSARLNNEIYRPRLNGSGQKHLLEDKWLAQIYFASLGLPVPEAIGVFHPQFGMRPGGASLRTSAELHDAIVPLSPVRLVFKPRGGRQGRHIVLADFALDGSGQLTASHGGVASSLDEFVQGLPGNAFNDYDGGYHGWLIQRCIEQHPFMLEIAPYAVNTFRIVTFIDAEGQCQVHFSVLRLGRRGSAADNWDKGGLSVFVDPATGRLGRGVFKPTYGGQRVSTHPDSGAELEGRMVPEWPRVLDICRTAAGSLSGIRSIGWDIALTPAGPVILEGNADWSLPLVQVHSKGYLSDQVRADLSKYGARFPERLRPLLPALGYHLLRQWRRSRGPAVLRRLMPHGQR